MSFKGFSLFSSCCYIVQRSGTILAILLDGRPRNNFYIIRPKPTEEMSFKVFFFFFHS